MQSGPIVVEIPQDLKTLADALVDLVGAIEDARRNARGGRAIDCAEMERKFAQLAARIELGALGGALKALDIDAPRVEIRGRSYTRLGRTRGTYRTMAGEVVLERTVYRERGVRNGPTVDPINLRTGAIGDGWLPQAARAMAFLIQQGTSRDAEATARETGRLPYSRNSFERVSHEVGEQYLECRMDIEDALIRAWTPPKEAHSLSVSIDRVSIPMEEPRSRPVGRPRKNAPKRPIERNFRMAYCGALAVHDASGAALTTLRYGTMPEHGGKLLAAEMVNDLLQILGTRPDLEVILLADGAPEMWGLMDADLNEPTLGKKPHRLIDFWHTIEKLAAAARVMQGANTASTTTRWADALRTRKGAAARILGELRRSGQEEVSVDGACPVHDAITYVENGRDRMDYAGARAIGLPIGSGNVEATCKTLVTLRMKRPGSRWKTKTGEHIVKLRALALSDRWEPAMTMFFTSRRTAVRRAA